MKVVNDILNVLEQNLEILAKKVCAYADLKAKGEGEVEIV